MAWKASVIRIAGKHCLALLRRRVTSVIVLFASRGVNRGPLYLYGPKVYHYLLHTRFELPGIEWRRDKK